MGEEEKEEAEKEKYGFLSIFCHLPCACDSYWSQLSSAAVAPLPLLLPPSRYCYCYYH